MEQHVKEPKLSFLEKVFIKAGSILDVRAWTSGIFFEVDLHLPETDMHKWKDTQHIKCKVATNSYRDYTPAFWDASTHTCTLYIDAAHDGAGSRWVKGLQAGDLFHYVGTASSHQRPVPNKTHILLGDESALGHFAAMQQLAGVDTLISGAFVTQQATHIKEFESHLPQLPIKPLLQQNDPIKCITEWLEHFNYNTEQLFFLAGNAKLVAAVRRFLRSKGISNQLINAQGFWH